MADCAVPIFVSVSWLKDNLNKPGIKVVDGTWHMPMWKRDSQAEYETQHIEGAVKFNVDAVADKSSDLPRALPPIEQFEDYIGKLGISSTDHVVVYDNNANFGMFSGPRVWYTFKLYGHDKVSVLDGGLPKWLEAGGPVESGKPQVEAVTYKGSYHPELFVNFEGALQVYKKNPAQILDARSVGRFEGRDPEPNPKIPSGRIIGSTNIFWRQFIDPETKQVKNNEGIQKVFSDAGVNLDNPNIASCGSGTTACWIAISASLCNKTIAVYTGSWIDWYKRGPEDSKIIGVKGEDLNK